MDNIILRADVHSVDDDIHHAEVLMNGQVIFTGPDRSTCYAAYTDGDLEIGRLGLAENSALAKRACDLLQQIDTEAAACIDKGLSSGEHTGRLRKMRANAMGILSLLELRLIDRERLDRERKKNERVGDDC